MQTLATSSRGPSVATSSLAASGATSSRAPAPNSQAPPTAFPIAQLTAQVASACRDAIAGMEDTLKEEVGRRLQSSVTSCLTAIGKDVRGQQQLVRDLGTDVRKCMRHCRCDTMPALEKQVAELTADNIRLRAELVASQEQVARERQVAEELRGYLQGALGMSRGSAAQ